MSYVDTWEPPRADQPLINAAGLAPIRDFLLRSKEPCERCERDTRCRDNGRPWCAKCGGE